MQTIELPADKTLRCLESLERRVAQPPAAPENEHAFEQSLESLQAAVRHSCSQAPRRWSDWLHPGATIKPFPVHHLATVDYLMEVARSATGRDRQVCHLLSLGLFHVVLEGGGIIWSIAAEDEEQLKTLIRRADESAKPIPAEPGHVFDLWSASAAIGEVLRESGGKLQHCSNPFLRTAVSSALGDLLRCCDRISSPPAAMTLEALFRYLVSEPLDQGSLDQGQRASWLSSSWAPVSPQPRKIKARAFDEAEEMIGNLRTVVGEAVESARAGVAVSSIQEGRGRRPAPTGRGFPSRLPQGKHVRRRVAHSSDSKAEQAWSRTTSQKASQISTGERQSLTGVDSKRTGSHFKWLWTLMLAGILVGLAWVVNGSIQEREFDRPPSPVHDLAEPEILASNPSEIAEAFAYAEKIEDRVALISDLRYTEAAREHFASVGVEESEVEFIQSLGQGRSGTVSFYGFRLGFKSGKNRLVCVVDNRRDGKLYVDWEAYVRWASAPWPQILGGEVDRAEVRVFVESGDYYNYDYADDQVYQCFRLQTPDLEQPLYGYVRRDSPRHALIAQSLRNKISQRMTLSITKPVDLFEEGQFYIDEVVANDWVKDPGEALEASAFVKDVSPDPQESAPIWLPSS